MNLFIRSIPFPLPIEVFDGNVKHIRSEIKQAKLTKDIVTDTPNETVVPYGVFLFKVFFPLFGAVLTIIGIALLLNSDILWLPILACGLVLLALFAWKRKKPAQK